MIVDSFGAWLTVLSAVLVSVIANGAIILVAWWRRKKIAAETTQTQAEAGRADAEAADVLTGTALRIVQRMEKKVIEMEAELAAQRAITFKQGQELRTLQCRVKILEDENDDLRRGAERLIGQLVSENLEPKWRPESV